MYRILLPMDFSERSIDAAKYAKALAERLPCEIQAIHVIDLRVYGMYGLVSDDLWTAAPASDVSLGIKGQMAGFLARVLEGVSVKQALLYGDPAHEIVKYAHSEKADLIMMPTHGHGPFRRFLLGSVTAKVLHDAECAVWTGVHVEAAPRSEPVAFNRILCALDPRVDAHDALAWGWKFGGEIGGQVRIVHAMPAIYSPGSADASVEMKKRMRDRAEAEIGELQQSAGSNAEVQIVTGDATEAVCAAASDWKADLMVIGRGLASEFFGRLRSRSYSIIRESPCPVVSV